MVRQKLNILEEIRKLVSGSEDPRATLRDILELLAYTFDLDLVSVYLFDEPEQVLRLAATRGRAQESVGEVTLTPGRGLTGLVLEQMQPIVVHQPTEHSRYIPLGESPERSHDIFIGLPLIYHQQTLGVLIIQSRDQEGMLEEHTPIFSAVATQIAAAVAYSGLLEEKDFRLSPETRSGVKAASEESEREIRQQGMLKGAPASHGIAEGQAHFLVQSIGFDQIQEVEIEDVQAEIERLDKALKLSEQEISKLAREVEGLSNQDKAILQAHLMLLQDRVFTNRIKEDVKNGFAAEFALKSVVMEYMNFFHSLEDTYLRERGTDIADIGQRVLRHLLGEQNPYQIGFQVPTIIVASDISPLELEELRQPNLAGVVLTEGGLTSHAVILARSFEIPMVIGAQEAVEVIRENDELILDGTSGLVFTNPPRSIRTEYERLKREKEEQFEKLHSLKHAVPRTLDGRFFLLGANIGLVSDTELVHKYGADHIGLYRTEFPFLAKQDFPAEEEQAELYSQVVQAAQGKLVTIRILDVGGDKLFSSLEIPSEDNPYLGWRAIRMTLELDHVLRNQIRAILRSSAKGPVRMLVPMVSSVWEIKTILDIVQEEKRTLQCRGQDFDPNLPVGIMLEVPAAVFVLPNLLRYIDFVSVGTNDLTQYVLAADRNNQKVASLYNPLHPSVLAIIRQAVSTCRQAGCPVSICGEAASHPKCARLFLAMEPDELSLNPAAVPLIKNLVRQIDVSKEKELLSQVLELEDTEDVSSFMDRTEHGTAVEIMEESGTSISEQPWIEV